MRKKRVIELKREYLELVQFIPPAARRSFRAWRKSPQDGVTRADRRVR